MPIKLIYLFRHGETDWNAERRFQGHTDIFLNEKGRQQAHELKGHLKELNLEVILSSDLSRALETAKIAAEGLNLPVIQTPDLREAFLGEPEGQLRDDIIKKYGEESWHKWSSAKAEDLDFCYPKGETKRAQLERIRKYIENYFEENPTSNVIGVSSHGGTLRRIIHHCAGAPTEAVPIPNCSLFKIEYDSDQKSWKYLGTLTTSKVAEKLFS